jgi:hypothetical protein
MHLRSCLLLVSLLPLLGSCSLFESPATRALRKSPDFQAGYTDGCSSAQSQGADRREDSLNRDAQAFANNNAYRTGWNTGFNGCRIGQLPSNQIGAGGGAFPPSPNPGSP